MSAWSRRHTPAIGEAFGDCEAVRETGVDGQSRLVWTFCCGLGHEHDRNVSYVRRSVKDYGRYRCPVCREDGLYDV